MMSNFWFFSLWKRLDFRNFTFAFKFLAFFSAIFRAFAEMSEQVMLRFGFSSFNEIPMMPEPVQRSRTFVGDFEKSLPKAFATFTMSSVSGRGMRTAGETRNLRP